MDKSENDLIIKTLLSFHKKYGMGDVPLKYVKDANYLHGFAIFFEKHGWLSELQIGVARNRLKRISQDLPIDVDFNVQLRERKKEGKEARLVKNKIFISVWSNSKSSFFDMIEKIKSLPRRKYDPGTKSWVVPIGVEALLNLKEWGFEMDENLTKKYNLLIPNIKEGEKIELPDSNISLYPYQKEGVAFIEKTNGRTLLADQMGCIAEGTQLIINRGGNGKRINIEDAYKRFNQLSTNKSHNWDLSIYTRTRSISLDHKEFRLNQIIDIVYSGEKTVYKVTTKSHSLEATNDHIFITTKGDIKLADLKKGDILYVNGIEHCPLCKRKTNLIIYKYSKFRGYCKKCMYNILRHNKRSEKGEYISSDGYIMITYGVSNHPHNRTDGIPKHRLIYEAYLNGISYKEWKDIILIGKFKKDHIFLTPTEIIHHKNRNKLDNNINNLQLLNNKGEHQSLHGNYKNFKGFFLPKKEKILSIEYVGIKKTYDIKMKDPNNSFIANGIVVHNCGKTRQSLTWTAIHPEKRPVIVVVPASLKINWQREIHIVLPNEKTTILYGKSCQGIEKEAQFVIVNYDILESKLEELQKLEAKIVILDECQAIRNSKSLRSIAVAKLVKNIPHVIALSGTPIENRPKEFFPILNLLKPDLWPNFWDYAMKYCNAKYNGFGWDFNGRKNTEELNTILRKTVMIRRTKEEVLKDLPPKIRTIVPIEMENRGEYERIVEKMGSHRGLLENIEFLRQVIIQGKIEGVVKWIETFLESDEKLIVFASHHWTIDTLVDYFKKKKIGVVKLDGRDSATKKQKAVDDFQLKEDIKLFIANTIAGGVGLNLTAASNIAIIELEWTSTKEDQAEDRAHRIGQTKGVNIWYLLAADTLEEDMAGILDEKRKTLSEILDGKDVEGKELLTMLLKRIKERNEKNERT